MSVHGFQGVVFDADGTLFDTERLAKEVWLAAAREMNAPQIEAHYMELIGRNHEGIVKLLRQVCPPDFPLDHFLETCAQRSRSRLKEEGVPLKEGAREILEFLDSRGVPAALATSSGRETTNIKLERSGLDRFFQAVITGDMVSRGKPDPEIYFTACRALGIVPSCSLAVEDSPNGIRSAHAAGMAVAMVPDLLPMTPDLEDLVWKQFASLPELGRFLSSID